MRRVDGSREWFLAAGMLALGVVASSTSCLRVNREHCMFAGGDLACDGGFCVGAVEAASDAIAQADADGCIAELPAESASWVHVQHGLPAAVLMADAPAGLDAETSTVEGIVTRVLQARGLAFDVSKDGCREAFEGLEALADVRARVEGENRRRTSVAALAFTSAERARIVAFDEELDRVLEVLEATCVEVIDTTGTSTGEDTTATEEGSTTTAGVPTCTDEECLTADPARPICGDDGLCVACNGAGGDAACAEAHPDLPVCLTEGSDIGTCVQCTEAATEACTGTTPLCNVDSRTCEPCVTHAQCMDAMGSACHIETGECLPADRVWHVDGDAAAGGDGSEATPYPTIAAALTNIAGGERGTIVLHQASSDYNATVSIDTGRVVAIVAPVGDRPRIATIAASGLVVVSGLDTVAYLEGLTITLNGAGPGLRVDAEAHAHVDRGEIINNNVGIAVANGAVLALRNSIVWTNQPDLAVLTVDGSTADVSYSTVAHTGSGFGTFDVVQCTNPTAVTVRNSLVVSRDDGANGWSCPGGTVSNSAGEDIPAGNGNVLLCDSAVDCAMDIIPQLFVSASNLRLNASGTSILADIPEPSPDDPPYDIDLNPRPSLSGTDYAGAHVPP
jgi:hypothetical protein